jgi:predicted nucleotidyltransferase
MSNPTGRATAPDHGGPGTEEIARVVNALLPPTHHAVLFGSRATDRARERSDWDIGIVVPGPVDGAVLERIRDALDALPTLQTFDVVDLATVAPEMRERALREGTTLG